MEFEADSRRGKTENRTQITERQDGVHGISSIKISYYQKYIFIFFLFSVFCFLFSSSSVLAAQPKQVCFMEQCVAVEIADTNASRARGLQGVTSMPADHGMLFVFSSNEIFSFWMKDTMIPLDMLWIDEARKVVDIKAGLPPCVSDPCQVYTPSSMAIFVLEVNAKYAETHGLKVGDQAVFK